MLHPQQPPDSELNDPIKWRGSAIRQLNALSVLKRGIALSSEEGMIDGSASAMMMAGFAFEAAFKSWFLATGNTLYRNGKRVALGHHDFATWIKDHGISLRGWEEEALDKAHFFCVAWGRYPFHDDWRKERPFESWGMSDVEQIENLIARLL